MEPAHDAPGPPVPGGDAIGRPADPDPRHAAGADVPLDGRSLSRLKWRCRRGLLENDLILERFLRSHEGTLSVRQAGALDALMELPDNDLLDLLLRRKEPDGRLDSLAVHEVLALLRRPAPSTVVSPR